MRERERKEWREEEENGIRGKENSGGVEGGNEEREEGKKESEGG